MGASSNSAKAARGPLARCTKRQPETNDEKIQTLETVMVIAMVAVMVMVTVIMMVICDCDQGGGPDGDGDTTQRARSVLMIKLHRAASFFFYKRKSV